MKNWSFGKMMGVFCGVLVLGIVLAVIIMKSSAAPKMNTAVVSTKHQTQYQEQPTDVLQAQMEMERRSASLKQQELAQQTQTMQQALQQQNQTLLQQMEAISNGLIEVDQRIQALEAARRNVGVEIIKPERAPRQEGGKQLAVTAQQIPASSGYKVQATVGQRAWIAAGEQETSVTVGDPLPPIKKPLTVTAVDSASGIVITSGNPR